MCKRVKRKERKSILGEDTIMENVREKKGG